jgi:hypothetical protein
VTAGQGDNNAQLKVTTISAQTSPSGYAAASGNGVVLAPAGSNKKNAAFFNGTTGVPAVNGNVVYASFLLNVQTLPTAGTIMRTVYLHNGTSTSGAMEAIVSETGQVGIRKKGNAGTLTYAAGTPVATPGTHLVVMCYTFQSGNDKMELWVDPSSSSYGSNSAPASSATNISGGDVGNPFTTIVVDSPNLVAGPVVWIDEVRVADTWAEVVPSGDCNPVGFTSGPVDTSVALGEMANFSVVATGSVPAFQWQVSTDAGGSWNNVSSGTGGATASYTTPALSSGDNGYKYRCIATVPCDSSSMTSSVATVTVVDITGKFFRSATSGNWNIAATWEQSTDSNIWSAASAPPSSAAANIVIRSHTVTVATTVTADQVEIKSGGKVSVAGGSFSILDAAEAFDLDAAGTLEITGGTNNFGTAGIRFQNGGVFSWNKAADPVIPTATWADGATCAINNISASAASVATGITGQDFYDLVVNYPSLVTGQRLRLGINGDTTIRRNFSITIPDLAAASVAIVTNGIITIGGDVTFVTGPSANTTKVLLSGSATSTPTYKVAGNFSISGYLDGFGSASGLVEFNKSGAQALSLPTGAALINGGSISYQVDSGSTLTLASSIGSFKEFTVTNGGTLSFGANQLTGSGTLTVSSGGTVIGNGTGQLTTALTALNFDGTLNINQSLPTFSGGETLPLFGATTYNITSIAIIPTTPPGAGSWDATTTPGTLIVVAGGGGGGRPKITSITRSGANLTLTGIGGTANGNYNVLTSASLNTARSTWSTNTSGAFDGSGNFSITFTTPGTSPSFFIIQE